MDGGLTAAILLSPPLYLRATDFLSKRWGPPQIAVDSHAVRDLHEHVMKCWMGVGKRTQSIELPRLLTSARDDLGYSR